MTEGQHLKGCHCLDCTGIILDPWDRSDEDAYQRVINHSGWFGLYQQASVTKLDEPM